MLVHLACGALLGVAIMAVALCIVHADVPTPPRDAARDPGAALSRGPLCVGPGVPRLPVGRLAAPVALTALGACSPLVHPRWIQAFLVLAAGSIMAALLRVLTPRHPTGVRN